MSIVLRVTYPFSAHENAFTMECQGCYGTSKGEANKVTSNGNLKNILLCHIKIVTI